MNKNIIAKLEGIINNHYQLNYHRSNTSKKYNYEYSIKQIRKNVDSSIILVLVEGKKDGMPVSEGIRYIDLNTFEFIKMRNIGTDLFMEIRSKLIPAPIIYTSKGLPIFDYQGHHQLTNSLLIYHGMEKGRYVFSINKRVERELIGGTKKEILERTFIRPKKVYKTSKGDYVNILGSRFYLGELYDNYTLIADYVKEGI